MDEVQKQALVDELTESVYKKINENTEQSKTAETQAKENKLKSDRETIRKAMQS